MSSDDGEPSPNSYVDGARKAVLAAAIGNTIVFVLKIAVANYTGSVSLYNEALHSAGDSFNQWILLVSVLFASPRLFIVPKSVYGMLSLIAIIGASAKLRSGHQIESISWALVVLAVSIIVESWTLIYAIRHVNGHGKTIWQRVFNDHPGTMFVVVEDSIAVTGLLVAALGIILSSNYKNSYYDACAGIIIGCLMAFGSILLIIRYLKFHLGGEKDIKAQE